VTKITSGTEPPPTERCASEDLGRKSPLDKRFASGKDQIFISMTSEEAVQLACKRFPFQEYMTPGSGGDGPYLNIANTVQRYLKPGNRILDFGCGPCDKTSVLQFLGFQCSGYDDLQDDWHKIPGNREKIMSFARECGIDFKLAGDGAFPFEKQSFDMVMLHDVIEHLHDSPRDLLNDLLELTKPEGLLFITVPNAVNIFQRRRVLLGRTNLPAFECYYWYPGAWRGHVREYAEDDLVKLCDYLNLEVLELKGCDHMRMKLPGILHPLYQFITGIFTGWKGTWLLVARKKPQWTSKKVLPRDEFVKILGKYTPFKYS
jgi:SAM-dependent methyltransferase